MVISRSRFNAAHIPILLFPPFPELVDYVPLGETRLYGDTRYPARVRLMCDACPTMGQVEIMKGATAWRRLLPVSTPSCPTPIIRMRLLQLSDTSSK
jgi:hypothetical protein